MPSLKWNLSEWDNPSNWPDRGDAWSAKFGGPRAQWFGSLLPRIERWLPAPTILEIAPGYGRWSGFLLQHCRRLVGVDYSPKCVEECSRRFSSFPQARFVLNDGLSLAAVPDGSVDFVFSFDALVHCEADVVKAYVAQIVRKLTPFGGAFIHHSNAAAVGVDWSARALSVSAAIVQGEISAAGGATLIQEEITWGRSERTDCLTTFCRTDAYPDEASRAILNDSFDVEMSLIKASISKYGQGDADG